MLLLQTSRLVIRPPYMEDFDEYWIMNNDPLAKKYTGAVIKLSYEDAHSIHSRTCNEFDETDKTNCVFSVIENSTNKCIGYCGFKHCETLNDIEILYRYSRDAWGKGYGYEAAQKVLQYGLDVLNLQKVVAAVNPQNVASEKILIKIGMKKSGQILWENQGMVNKYLIAHELPSQIN